MPTVPSLFCLCADYLRQITTQLKDFSWLEGVPPYVVERGALLDRVPEDLSTLRTLEFQAPDMCEFIEPQWKQLCRGKRLSLPPGAEASRTPWRDLYTDTEERNNEKLVRIREQLKIMNKQERKAKALKQPRMVVVKTHGSHTKHGLAAPTLNPAKRHKTQVSRYADVPVTANSSTPSSGGARTGRLQVRPPKPLQPFEQTPSWMKQSPAPVQPSRPVPQKATVPSKQLKKVLTAFEDALLPHANSKAKALAAALERAVGRVAGGDKGRYKDRIVMLIMALQDKQSRVARALASGEVEPGAVAAMESKQLLKYKPQMAVARAAGKHKHTSELMLQGSANGLEMMNSKGR
eukprot:TRINITY_DN18428_c0_g1_i4.p1 TRINITY_DN18428_c0_g1~~TRINITY_DN18428_c0_g1_i4.p1  ORF type:complete len:349 (-),score=70.62 TRINITY_DN18428_c0_g1_i4:230-1276(-)